MELQVLISFHVLHCIDLSIPLCVGKSGSGHGLVMTRGRNGKFCVKVYPVARTTLSFKGTGC